AKELFEEVGPLDAFFAPRGGGGLVSGGVRGIRAPAPAFLIYGVEPEAGIDGQRSLRSGAIVHIVTPQPPADGA
ncbi:serine dehydratase, partial [Escherichia coli]|nr:serine dehydratase [Escherichia coli]